MTPLSEARSGGTAVAEGSPQSQASVTDTTHGAGPGYYSNQVRRGGVFRTDAEVTSEERGSDEEENRAARYRQRMPARRARSKTDDVSRGSAIRSGIASELRGQLSDMKSALDTPRLAVMSALFRRSLAESHEKLAEHPSQTSFLTVVTALEAAAVNLRWNKSTATELDSMISAITSAYVNPVMTHAEAREAVEALNDSGFEMGPVLGLEDLLPDEEEGKEDDDE